MCIFKKKKICVTHNGTFHADDLFTTAVFYILNNGNIKVIRTRDEKILRSNSFDYIYDVGGEYDPEKNKFDHHQKDSKLIRENGVPYASFGLVWKTYGEKLCGNRNVADLIDKKIIEAIDAIDNGVNFAKSIYDGSIPLGPDIVFMDNLPTWKESNKNFDKIFIKQVKKVVPFLLREIEVAKADVEAWSIMQKAYEESSDKRIVIMNNDFPRYLYQDFFSKLDEVIYLVFPSGHSSRWKVEAIHKNPNTMEARKPFPESWGGYTNGDKKLVELTGVSDAEFCHKSGFLSTAFSKEGAVALAEKALIS